MRNLFKPFSKHGEKMMEESHSDSRLEGIESHLSEVLLRLSDVAHSANCAKNSSWYSLSENEIVTSLYTGQFIIVDRRDLSLTPSLVLTGEWELKLAQFFRSLIKPGDVVFDIGANVGYFGLIASTQNGDGETHFFEANPDLANLIAKSCQLNALPVCKSSVINKAIGREKGCVTLRKPVNLWGSASCHNSIFSDEQAFEGEYVVEMDSVDNYCAVRGSYKCNVIKIDVEGYEEEVLNGMSRLIDSNSELYVVMEYTFGAYSESFIDLLRKWFNKIYIFTEHKGLVEVADLGELAQYGGHGTWCTLVLMKG